MLQPRSVLTAVIKSLLVSGEQASYEHILAGVRRRDHINSTRDVAPLSVAKDAVIINSDGLSIAQVLEHAGNWLPRLPRLVEQLLWDIPYVWVKINFRLDGFSV